MRSTFCLRIRVKGRTRGSGARPRGAGDAGPGGSAHNATLPQPKKRRRRVPRRRRPAGRREPRRPAWPRTTGRTPGLRGGGSPGVDAGARRARLRQRGSADHPHIGDSAHSRGSAAAAQPGARHRPRLGVLASGRGAAAVPRSGRPRGPRPPWSVARVLARPEADLGAKPKLLNVILAAFTGTIPVNVDTVVHGAQVAGSRVTLARGRYDSARTGRRRSAGEPPDGRFHGRACAGAWNYRSSQRSPRRA
jgi:hypothetical protein